jgi:hypothetical protein
VYYGSSNLHIPQSKFTCASLEELEFWTENEEDREVEVVMLKFINLPRLRKSSLGENFICALFFCLSFPEGAGNGRMFYRIF